MKTKEKTTATIKKNVNIEGSGPQKESISYSASTSPHKIPCTPVKTKHNHYSL